MEIPPKIFFKNLLTRTENCVIIYMILRKIFICLLTNSIPLIRKRVNGFFILAENGGVRSSAIEKYNRQNGKPASGGSSRRRLYTKPPPAEFLIRITN